MIKRVVDITFEDYAFKYFHEGYATGIIRVNTHGENYYIHQEISVRELELMMFGC